MLKRAIIEELTLWSESPARKPLILRGARQVGKTTAVHEFSDQFDQYLYLNLDLKEDRDLFTQDYSIDELVAAIHFHKKTSVNPEAKTLLFIDEIQNSPKAVAMLRYFYEKRNDLYLVAAGSLLETLIDTHISFPVGRVEYKYMYPLSFEEYLLGADEPLALQALQETPCPAYAHQNLLKLFHQYALVGGLPEAVSMFVKNNDIVSVNGIYHNLMTAYIDDVAKYAKNKTMEHIIRHAIQHAPLQAGNRIKFQNFGQSNYKSREMGEALRTLEKAMLIKLVYPTTAVELPIESNHKKSPKLQFIDTGMVNAAAGLQQHYFSLKDLTSIYKGKIAEHIVGQELLTNYPKIHGELNFWVREQPQSNAEIDYVVPFEGCIIPIEVKSGKTGTLKSLQQFMDRAPHSCAVRLYAGPIQQDNLSTPTGKKFTLLSLPYYLVSQLYQYLPTLAMPG